MLSLASKKLRNMISLVNASAVWMEQEKSEEQERLTEYVS